MSCENPDGACLLWKQQRLALLNTASVRITAAVAERARMLAQINQGILHYAGLNAECVARLRDLRATLPKHEDARALQLMVEELQARVDGVDCCATNWQDTVADLEISINALEDRYIGSMERLNTEFLEQLTEVLAACPLPKIRT